MVRHAAQSQGAERAARARELRVLRVVGLAVFGADCVFHLGRLPRRLQIEGAQEKRAKKAWLAVSLLVNLGLLAYFKYANFFIESWSTRGHRRA